MNLLELLRPESSSLQDLRKQLSDAEKAHVEAQSSVAAAEKRLECDEALEALDAIANRTARRVRMAAAALAQGEAQAKNRRNNELIKHRGDLETRYRALCRKADGQLLEASVKALKALAEAQVARAEARSDLIKLGGELRACLSELLGPDEADEACRALDRDLPNPALSTAIMAWRDTAKVPPVDTPARRAHEELTSVLYRGTH